MSEAFDHLVALQAACERHGPFHLVLGGDAWRWNAPESFNVSVQNIITLCNGRDISCEQGERFFRQLLVGSGAAKSDLWHAVANDENRQVMVDFLIGIMNMIRLSQVSNDIMSASICPENKPIAL